MRLHVGRLRVNCLGLLRPVYGDSQRYREDRRLLARVTPPTSPCAAPPRRLRRGDQLGVGPAVPHAHAAVLSNRAHGTSPERRSLLNCFGSNVGFSVWGCDKWGRLAGLGDCRGGF